MATVFSDLQSTRGNPYVTHTLSYTLGERTKTTQVYNFTLVTKKATSTSSIGTGYAYSCYINVNGTGEKAFSYKAKDDVWNSGSTTGSTKTFSYTANIDPKTTSVPLTFRTACTYAYDGDTDSCTTDKKNYNVSANAYTFNSKMKVNDEWKDGQFYIKVNDVWKKATPYVNVNGTWKKCE